MRRRNRGCWAWNLSFRFKVIRYGEPALSRENPISRRAGPAPPARAVVDGFEQSGDGFVVAVEAFLQLGKLLREFFCSRRAVRASKQKRARPRTLASMATGRSNTLASMMAPCSVKTHGGVDASAAGF